MAEIKLFDTWTFQEEMPEPFSQFLKKEGLRKTTTMVEWLSQYNQGRQATLHPPTLRAKETVIWLSEEHENNCKTSRFYYPVQLSPWRSLQMIRQLDCWYADTDLDCREYAEEYQRIVSGILHGLVILNPKKLALEEVIAEWEVNFTEPEKSGYRTAFDEIRKGKIPIIRDCNYTTDER